MGSQRSSADIYSPTRESTPTSPSLQQRAPGSRSHGNPFSSKVNGVLSTSYADSEFREVLSLMDERGLANSPEVRRQIRPQLQKEVIESNGEIIREFGHVAEVSPPAIHKQRLMSQKSISGDGLVSWIVTVWAATSPHRCHP